MSDIGCRVWDRLGIFCLLNQSQKIINTGCQAYHVLYSDPRPGFPQAFVAYFKVGEGKFGD